MNRRKFLSIGGLSLPALSLPHLSQGAGSPKNKPIVICTWPHNTKASAAAWKVLEAGGSALDAVEQGVMVPEADPTDQSVGYGGLPDRDGRVTLDACIMDHNYRCGAVMGLEYILHPISVARLVMEKTPHVQLVGEGALKFALESGFEKTNLLTPESERAWKKWLETAKYDPMTTIDNLLERIKNNHDTIGMIAMDAQGNLSGACTTSGMAYKMRGRVGDSPIIGAGLYVDNEVGAATCTGVGEEMVRVCASHTAVEIMRQGKSPEAACKEAVARIVKANGAEKARKLQAAVIAINREGEYGCYSLNSDFAMPVQTAAGVKIIKAPSWF